MELNDRMKIVIRNSETDDSGFAIENEEFFSCFCKYTKKSGTETLKTTDTAISEQKVMFSIRYGTKSKELLSDPLATKKYAVEYKGSEYDIKDISDFNNSHMYIDLICELRA